MKRILGYTTPCGNMARIAYHPYSRFSVVVKHAYCVSTAYGAAQEIYFGDISRNFVGSTFAEASSAIYTETSAVLIGLVGERSIDLNPGAKVCPQPCCTHMFDSDRNPFTDCSLWQ
jgi:hypothetical protein